MATLHFGDNKTFICDDGLSFDCWVLEGRVFFQECLASDRYETFYDWASGFDGYFVDGSRVCFQVFFQCLWSIRMTPFYNEACRTLYLSWVSDTPLTYSVGYDTLCFSSSLPSVPVLLDDRAVDKATLFSPSDIPAPVELVIEGDTFVIHRGMWSAECWFCEGLYTWVFDERGYEIATRFSLSEIDMCYVDGWFFDAVQVAQYFETYRMTEERTRLVAPLLISYFKLRVEVYDLLSSRVPSALLCSELHLCSDARLRYRHLPARRFRDCTVDGLVISFDDGSSVPLQTPLFFYLGFDSSFTLWLIRLSGVLNGEFNG